MNDIKDDFKEFLRRNGLELLDNPIEFLRERDRLIREGKIQDPRKKDKDEKNS